MCCHCIWRQNSMKLAVPRSKCLDNVNSTFQSVSIINQTILTHVEGYCFMMIIISQKMIIIIVTAVETSNLTRYCFTLQHNKIMSNSNVNLLLTEINASVSLLLGWNRSFSASGLVQSSCFWCQNHTVAMFVIGPLYFCDDVLNATRVVAVRFPIELGGGDDPY
jgi:hypothetical protein